MSMHQANFSVIFVLDIFIPILTDEETEAQ